MFFMCIDKLIGLLFEIMFSDKLSEVIQLLNVLVFVSKRYLFFIVRKKLVDYLLIDDVLSRLICQLMAEWHIFE